MHGKKDMMQTQKRASTCLAEITQEKQPDEALRQNIIEGRREMYDVYADIEGEFHSLEEEVARSNDRRKTLPFVR